MDLFVSKLTFSTSFCQNGIVSNSYHTNIAKCFKYVINKHKLLANISNQYTINGTLTDGNTNQFNGIILPTHNIDDTHISKSIVNEISTISSNS